MNRQRTLEMAAEIVASDRQRDYGTPERNFETIADLWRVYLDARLDACPEAKGGPIPLEPHDVAVMLGLVKVARLVTSPQKADNWIDLAGYAACGAEVAGAE